MVSQNAQRFGIKEKKGVVITNVEPSSPADAAGLIPGEAILEIDRRAISNLSDYEKVTKEVKGDALIRTSRGFFLVKEKID